MRVWIIETGEPMPGDKASGRLWRAGLLSRVLATRGHHVIWWSSTFDHSAKKPRASGFSELPLSNNLRAFLLPAPTYKRNVSVARLWSQYVVARQFRRYAASADKPDIILCCVPTLELGAAATAYGRGQGVPVVLDYRDLWPEIFVFIAPKHLRPLFRLALWPLYRLAHKAFSRADAITGITSRFVEEALKHAGRPQCQFDRAFPHGYDRQALTAADRSSANLFWKNLGVCRSQSVFTMCFFGGLSQRHEFQLVIEGTKALLRKGRDLRLILCGTGECFARCSALASDVPEIILPGWVNYPKIATLMEISDVGLIPYPTTPDFAASYPNKAIEYFSGGLPVLSSINGVLRELLAEWECGITYPNNDVAGFVDSVEKLIDEPRTRRRMSENAKTLFERQFQADAVYSAFAEHLELIAETKKLRQIA